MQLSIKLLSCIGGWLLAINCLAQQSRRERLDSLYNGQFQTPAVSTIILPKGYIEVNNTAALLTTKRIFNATSQLEDLNARVSRFNNLFQLTYGVSREGRLNLGVDLLYNKFRVDLDPASSPLKVFSNDSAYSQGGAINAVGLHFRWRPKGIPAGRQFVLQGFLYQPVYKPRESQTSIRIQAVTVFDLGPYLYLYAQYGVGYGIPMNNINGGLSVPATALLQYQLTTTTSLLGVVAHTMSFGAGNKNSWQLNAFETQLGTGLQFQPSLRMGLNFFYTRYLLGKNSGAFDAVTLGIRSVI